MIWETSVTLGPNLDRIAWGLGVIVLIVLALCLTIIIPMLVLHALRTIVFVQRMLSAYAPPKPRPWHEWVVAPFPLFWRFFLEPTDYAKLHNGRMIYWPGAATKYRDE